MGLSCQQNGTEEGGTTSATVNNKKDAGYRVHGKILNANANQQMFLQLIDLQRKINIIDTAVIAADGSFEMKGTLPHRSLCNLMVSAGNRRSIYFIVDNQSDIELNVDITDPNNYEIKGDAENMQLRSFVDNLQNQRQGVDYIKAYADTVTSPFVGYIATNSMKIEQAYKLFQKQSERMRKTIPNNPLTSAFTSYVNSKKALALTAIGSQAPDITLNDVDGKSLPLTSLKGKVVLVDFWASWCRPCRRENPNVVKAYAKYKSKGFEVYSVSLDKTKDKWLAAIKQDNLTWDAHVSDLQGWRSAAAAEYGVSSIPQTFLLDKDGKIIAKNLRGIALERKLEELLGA